MSLPHATSVPARPVFLCSPFRGATVGESQVNVEYAKAAMLDSLTRGEAPFVTHLLYPMVLDDSMTREREMGCDAALANLARSPRVVVYTDNGVSQGMLREMNLAERLGIPVEHRSLDGWARRAEPDQPTSPRTERCPCGVSARNVCVKCG